MKDAWKGVRAVTASRWWILVETIIQIKFFAINHKRFCDKWFSCKFFLFFDNIFGLRSWILRWRSRILRLRSKIKNINNGGNHEKTPKNSLQFHGNVDLINHPNERDSPVWLDLTFKTGSCPVPWKIQLKWVVCKLYVTLIVVGLWPYTFLESIGSTRVDT